MSIAYIDPVFFYSAIIAPFLVVWLAVFTFSPDTRREQIRVSVVFAIAGAFVDVVFYFKDYWQPQSAFGFHVGSITLYPESLLYGGAFAGVMSVVYQIISRRRLDGRDDGKKWTRILECLALFFGVSVALWYFGLNSIYATAAGACAITLAVVVTRRDLFVPAIMSGLAASVMMFAFYELLFAFAGNASTMFSAPTWLLDGTNLDVRLAGVPLTELVWGFCAGSSLGVFYKFVKNSYFV